MTPKKPGPLTRDALLSELRDKPQRCEFSLDRASIDEDTRTVRLAFCSELPYQRWFGMEVLDCKAKAVRLDRLNDRAALLVNHDRDQQAGVVEPGTARMERDRVGRATVRFGRSAFAREIFQDVVDEIRTKVSVGYLVHDLVLEKKEGDVSTYRVTDWEPFEVSLVSVPADSTVGVGRALEARTSIIERKPTMGTKHDQPDTGNPQPEDLTPAKAVVKTFTHDNAQQRADERALVAARNREILAIGESFKEYGADKLALTAIGDDKMTVDAFREAVLEVIEKKQKQPTRTGQLERDRQAQPGGMAWDMAPREMVHAANLKVFKGLGRILGKEDHEVAYRAGMWARATIFGDPNAMRWCRDAGVELRQGSAEQFGFGERAMTEGIFTSAGWLVPSEMETAIIANREQYGVARRICNVIPMGTATTSIPRVTSDVTAYFVGEGNDGTESDSAGDQVQLNLKDLMAYTKIGKSTAMDAVIPLAEMVAREQARAFAIKEDACLIVGDGTSTYGGMMGIKTLLDAAAYAGGKHAAASGHDTFAEVDTADVTGLLGKLPVYARAGARWVCSGVFEALVFGRLKLTAGGNTNMTVREGVVESDYAGFPVSVAHNMPAGSGTTYNGVAILLLGNFNLGVAFGSGSGMMLTVDPYTLAHQHLTRVITTERIDINAHGVHKSTTVAGPICGLHGTT